VLIDMCAKFIFAIAIAGAAAVAPLRAQDGAATKNDPYELCIAKIKNAPLEAYRPCKEYLEQTSDDDATHREYVSTWILRYERVLPYLQFLQGLTADTSAPWFVYEPDMHIQLPETSDTDGPYKIQISRSFNGSIEEDMLRKAEAVYSSPANMIADVFRSLKYWADETPEDMEPIWGALGNDNLQSTNVVTARAVRYYYDLSLAAKANPHLPTGFDAVATGLKYNGVIKHFDRYSHKENSFENVYVADLTLDWSFSCGGLCGVGFTRNKLVVLDAKGSVLAVYLDAPENSQIWMS
jgi:hypothetical protein